MSPGSISIRLGVSGTGASARDFGVSAGGMLLLFLAGRAGLRRAGRRGFLCAAAADGSASKVDAPAASPPGPAAPFAGTDANNSTHNIDLNIHSPPTRPRPPALRRA
jgi:hypothetical protein